MNGKDTKSFFRATDVMWLKRLLTWWNGQTLGTQIFTLRKGQRVGEDEDGNLYFQDRDGHRRWVIYNGEMEASRVPVEWHGWLHHTFHDPPTEKPLHRYPWQAAHRRNLTGSREAARPSGSLSTGTPTVPTDYIAWNPVDADKRETES